MRLVGQADGDEVGSLPIEHLVQIGVRGDPELSSPLLGARLGPAHHGAPSSVSWRDENTRACWRPHHSPVPTTATRRRSVLMQRHSGRAYGGEDMTTFLRRPSRALAPFVELLWYVDEPMPNRLERRLPTGGMQIVVNLAEDELRWYDGERLDVRHVASGAALSGPVARAIGIDTAEQRQSIGVAFRPGGGAPFFAPPAVEPQRAADRSRRSLGTPRRVRPGTCAV